MTENVIIGFIYEKYEEWKKLNDFDDLDLVELIERDVVAEIIRYAYDAKLEIPGYDLNEVFKFIDRDEDSENYDPDDDDFNLQRIYEEIYFKSVANEIILPDEFLEVKNYFENVFWNDSEDD